MLDRLGMTAAALRWEEILNSPELADYTPQQLLRAVIEPQYVERMNHLYETNLRLSRLVDKSARTENLKTGNGRRYNDDLVQQLLTFGFVEKRMTLA